MLAFRLKLSKAYQQRLNGEVKVAQQLGKVQQVKRLLAILAVADEHSIGEVAQTLRVSPEAVRQWLNAFLGRGVAGLRSKKSPGRPPKLTKAQKKQLCKIIDQGPEQAGFPGACWRSPMIQHLIYETWGVSYSEHYISQLLKNLDYSYQKARFVSDHLD
jgi:transposase